MHTAGDQPALTQSLFALKALASLPPVQTQLSTTPAVVTTLLRLMRTAPAASSSSSAAAATRARQLTAAALLVRMCDAPHTADALLHGGDPGVLRRAASSGSSTASGGAPQTVPGKRRVWVPPTIRAAAYSRSQWGLCAVSWASRGCVREWRGGSFPWHVFHMAR